MKDGVGEGGGAASAQRSLPRVLVAGAFVAGAVGERSNCFGVVGSSSMGVLLVLSFVVFWVQGTKVGASAERIGALVEEG